MCVLYNKISGPKSYRVLEPEFSNVGVHQNHSGSVWSTQISRPCPCDAGALPLDGIQESAFSTAVYSCWCRGPQYPDLSNSALDGKRARRIFDAKDTKWQEQCPCFSTGNLQPSEGTAVTQSSVTGAETACVSGWCEDRMRDNRWDSALEHIQHSINASRHYYLQTRTAL